MKNFHRPAEISLKNVRCFNELQTARLRPITFLVGENSTGKTTLLGCYSMLHQLFHDGWSQVNFNLNPFNMGSFKNIVRIHTEGSTDSQQFDLRLGYDHNKGSKKQVTISFARHQGQPSIKKMKFDLDNSTAHITKSKDDSFSVNVGGIRSKLNFRRHFDFLPMDFLLFSLMSGTETRGQADDISVQAKQFFDEWFRTGTRRGRLAMNQFSLVSLAPLRAAPRRTYDPVKESSSPEGDHVPMQLMRLALSNSASWEKLRKELVSFGNEAGMFSDITVMSHGQDLSDPFQIQVQARSNAPANLIDVGYGVSQSLPILVDVLGAKNTQFILQQPEVHLHPRAQAELANLFVESVKTANNQFLMETHSDFFIDRIRINVKQGNIAAEDVSILFFEPNDESVKIHNLSLDENGNLEGAPEGYRDFFLKETDRLIGFDTSDED